MRRGHHSLPWMLLVCGIWLFAGCARPAISPDSRGRLVTFGTLLGEMVDLAELSRFPDPDYRTLQFSSHDRRSKLPYTFGWFGNNDGIGGETIPNFQEELDPPGADGVGRYLLADVNGAGAIARTWTTHPAPMEGRLTVWLDDARRPLFDGPAQRFLRDRVSLFGGDDRLSSAGFTQADACYLPIPFARRLRIEWRGSIRTAHYYHVQVRRYAKGVAVKTFHPDDLKTWRRELLRVQRILTDPDQTLPPDPTQPWRQFSMVVPPGQSVPIVETRSPGAIEYLAFSTDPADREAALREVVLEAAFDGAFQPQVEAPLGAFFSSAPGLTPFNALPLSVHADGRMVSRFVMPFQGSAELRLRNYGVRPHFISGWAAVSSRRWDPRRSLHFFARWQSDIGLLANFAQESSDLPFLLVRGRGRLVGVAMMPFNPTPYCTGNGGWWGEGDEKIWVDDDAFPSIFGTGTEDFFNYSWCGNAQFSHAYCGQPLVSGPGVRGFTVDQRWLALDAVPFRRRLDFYMELQTHAPTPGFDVARTLYYYATLHSRDGFGRISPAQVLHRSRYPDDWHPLAFGEPDARFFQAEEVLLTSESAAVAAIEEGGMWARDHLLRWTPAQPGECLTFRIPIREGGDFDVFGVFAVAPDAGCVELNLDGRPLPVIPEPPSEPIGNAVLDLHAPDRTRSVERSFGRLRLAAGAHELRMIARPSDPDRPGKLIGVDFFRFSPVREQEASTLPDLTPTD